MVQAQSFVLECYGCLGSESQAVLYLNVTEVIIIAAPIDKQLKCYDVVQRRFSLMLWYNNFSVIKQPITQRYATTSKMKW